MDDIKQGPKESVDRIHSLTTRLRFRHQALGCYLRAANAILPQWGFKQVEVSCDKENNPKDVHTYWIVESHWNDRCMISHPALFSSISLTGFVVIQYQQATPNFTASPSFGTFGASTSR